MLISNVSQREYVFEPGVMPSWELSGHYPTETALFITSRTVGQRSDGRYVVTWTIEEKGA